MRKTRAHAVNVVLFAVCMGLGGGAYAGLLPARMSILPLFPILSAALFYGAAWWIQRFPAHVNMPNQAAYDALPEEEQQRVVACTLPFFYWSTAIWLGFFITWFSFDTTAAIIVAVVVANIAEGGLAVRILFLKAPRKVRELQEGAQDRSR
ncbi:hypothetical protein [Salinibacter sp.]|uniref:hypothetical protein n=2 Tax=Salinibacteraceae TaxID=1853225 RepID=UPI0021E8F47B|nr:hypothetical protein [Salinibacter sp.]